MRDQSVLSKIALALVLIGAINWGLIGLFDYNLVSTIFGEGTTAERVAYILVGAASLFTLPLFATYRDRAVADVDVVDRRGYSTVHRV